MNKKNKKLYVANVYIRCSVITEFSIYGHQVHVAML